MGSRLIPLVVSALVAVLALPAVASASPQLFEGSTAVAANSSIRLSSDDFGLTNTPFGWPVCGEATFTATVDSNTGTEISASGTAGTITDCWMGKTEVTVTEPELVSLLTKGNDEGLIGLTFKVDFGPLECAYGGIGHFTYTTGTDTLNISEMPVGSSEVCMPAEDYPRIDAEFTLTTANGSPLTIK